jgi:pyruvate/2-oxoacid:ferredoxin oxidoreductase alpha subunit
MRMLLRGNDAVAYGANLARPKVIAAYPITPQSPIYEKLSEWDSQQTLSARMMRVESEHSAMAACISASLTGVRTFTATASQGLALMHELLHFASGMRVPVVLVNVNRAMAAPWSFWSEQTDSLSQRDTGWLQFYVSDNQEALDTVLQAFRISETVSLPTMVVLEAFYISHFMEPVEVPDQDDVDRFLPPYEPAFKLTTTNPATFCQTVTQSQYAEFRKERHRAMLDALEVAAMVDLEFQNHFGRGYGLIEKYRLEDAETVLVTAGTIGCTAKVVIDELREEGRNVGMIRIRLFRPFPKAKLVEALSTAKKIAVIDRNLTPGQEGIFCEELKASLYDRLAHVPVVGFTLGLGGTNVSPNDIKTVFSIVEQTNTTPPDAIVDVNRV